tara:strand:- start:642 stop:1532 length:891 start_codon:yes stop_codon:yes gene_type:complete
MAGAGWKSYSTGDLISATEFQTFIQDQVIQVYANASARDTALGTSDAEGMFCFLKNDGSGNQVLQFYNGSAWVNFIGEGDLTGITAGAGLSGGGTSGAVSLALNVTGQSSGTIASGDEILFGDISDSNNFKKTTAQSIADLASVTSLITNVTVKVADDGSGSQNVFYMLSGSDTGAGTKTPALDVSFGMKIRFDISDSSFSGHNLKFSTTKDGNHNSGAEFTTNVTTNSTGGNTGAYVQLEITPETMGTATATGSAIQTLYYYCSNHSGMGGNGKLSLYPEPAEAGVSLGLVLALS